MERLTFRGENGETVDFYVLEQTRVGGVNYLLAADSAEGDGECVIFRDLSDERERESLYEIVEDEQEQEAVLAVFEQLLEDVDITR
ncbi:MAG: DUF1292 domain-containing protein [Lachnospiraceae bacterium]